MGKVVKKILIILITLITIYPVNLKIILAITTPNWGNDSCYGSGNPFSKYECTWYVYGRVKEVTGINLSSRTSQWVNSSTSGGYLDMPVSNSIAMYLGSDGIQRHVAYIESCDGNRVTFSEGNASDGQGVQKYKSETTTSNELYNRAYKVNSTITHVKYIPLKAINSSSVLPAAPCLKINTTSCTINDTVNISWTQAKGASSYWLHIYRNGEDYINQSLNNSLSFCSKFPRGKYTAYVVSCNSSGESLSYVNFNVYGDNPEKPKLKINKELFISGEEVRITWSKTLNTEGYWLHIYKDGKDYVNRSIGLSLVYTNHFPKGKYRIYIVSINPYGETNSYIDINVTDLHVHKYTSRIIKQPTCVNVGEKAFNCSCGKSYIESIPAKGHQYQSIKVNSTYFTKGYTANKCSICGSIANKKDISLVKMASPTAKVTDKSIKLSWKKVKGAKGYNIYQNGKKIKSVTTTGLTIKKLKSGTTYKYIVQPYTKSDKKVINGNNSKTLTVSTNPTKVTISSVKPGKKQLTVKYKKVTGASGYQIGYSTSKSKGFKYITVNSKTVSKVIKKLKSKKNYYVKVRAYKSVGKKKYYGDYSSVKTVKIK